MSWYRESGGTFRKRIPIRVYDSGAGTGGDVQVTIPETLEEFWDAVDSSGDDVRVTLQDGATLADYDFSSFNASTRTAVLQVDSPNLQYDFSNVDQQLLWLYYDPDVSLGSASTSLSFFSDYKAWVDEAGPSGRYQFAARPEEFGSSQPTDRIHKYTDETIWVWVDMSPTLARRAAPYVERLNLEEVASVTYDVQTGGASQSSMIEADSTKIVETDDGRTWAGVLVKGGSSGTDYTLEVVWRAWDGRTDSGSADTYSEHRWSALIDVQDLDES